jgi:hypothetical protein
MDYRLINIYGAISLFIIAVLMFIIGYWFGKKEKTKDINKYMLINNYSNAGVLIGVMDNIEKDELSDAQDTLKGMVNTWITSWDITQKDVNEINIDFTPTDKIVGMYKRGELSVSYSDKNLDPQ